MAREVSSKEPWWEKPPEPGQTDEDLVWGWLTVYSDGGVVFDTTNPPTNEEILHRSGCRNTAMDNIPDSVELIDGIENAVLPNTDANP
ncbi:MAG: hypothetical protein V3W04_13790 [Gammaproteobacteria bacterium]